VLALGKRVACKLAWMFSMLIAPMPCHADETVTVPGARRLPAPGTCSSTHGSYGMTALAEGWSRQIATTLYSYSCILCRDRQVGCVVW
jgi:hypothetical protein